MGASDAFTREDQELLDYDADAFFYFSFAMLLTILIPWTLWFLRSLTRPRPLPDQDYETFEHHKKGAKVRHFSTAIMVEKRQAAAQVAMSWKQRLNFGAKMQLLVIICLWGCLGWVFWRLQFARQLSGFDPYDILGIEVGADEPAIKKAYRRKSLEFHPDKNPDNPLASVLFMKVSKAYAALTNEAARKNYEKYGNPDGPVGMKVSVALHPALVGTKEMQLATLCFFFVMLFILPGVIIFRCFRSNQLNPGSVDMRTLRILHGCIEPESVAEEAVSLFSSSVEARSVVKHDKKSDKGDTRLRALHKAMSLRSPKPPSSDAICEIDGLKNAQELNGKKGRIKRHVAEKDRWEVEILDGDNGKKNETKLLKADNFTVLKPDFKCIFSDEDIVRNTMLLWAHMWRLHDNMTPDLRSELDQLLKTSVRVGRSMIAMTIHGQGDRSRFFEAMVDLVEFRRSLVQSLDLRSSPYLQLPHVTEVPSDAPEFRELVRNGGPDDALTKRMGLTPEQLLDVRAFCANAPLVELSYEVYVTDEEDIAENDVATLEVTLKRTHLKPGECAGPVHAPLFPIPKHEEWWLVIFDNRSRRLVSAEIVLGTGYQEKSKTLFQVPRSGPFRWTVHALCDSYLGLDVVKEVQYFAKKAKEVKKPYFLHPEDANIKTWFEEIMMGLQEEMDSDSESEEEEIARRNAIARKKAEEEAAAAKAIRAVKAKGKSSNSDSDSDSDDSDKERKKDSDDSDDSDDSANSSPKSSPKSAVKKPPVAAEKLPPAASAKLPVADAENSEKKTDAVAVKAEAGTSEKKTNDTENSEKKTDSVVKAGAEDSAKKPDAETKAKAVANIDISDDSSDDDEDPTHAEADGHFFRVDAPQGVCIHSEPREVDETRIGSLPQKALVRGFLIQVDPMLEVQDGKEEVQAKGKGKGKGKDGEEAFRPATAWVELAGSNGCVIVAERQKPKNIKREDAWKSESGIAKLGKLEDQQLRVVVQTVTPIRLVRQWMRSTAPDKRKIEAEDVFRLREIEADRVRSEVEELARKRFGDELYDKLLDEVEALAAEKRKKMARAVGTFKSASTGMLWRVSASGFVRGLQPNGARIRDRVETVEPSDPSSGKPDEMRLGPFRLATASETSLHWERADEPSWSMTWSADCSLETRMRLAW